MGYRYQSVSRLCGAAVESPQGTNAGRFSNSRQGSSTILGIGKRPRLLRIANHLSEETPARSKGLLHQNISAFENNHSVSTLDTLEKLACGLECKLHELFYRDEDFSELAISMSKEKRQGSWPDANFLAAQRAALARMSSKDRKLLNSMTVWMADQREAIPEPFA
jgi:transcriptional regulator with XRE-family HTH domain